MAQAEIQINILQGVKVSEYTNRILAALDESIDMESMGESLAGDLKLVVWELVCNLLEHGGVADTVLYVRISSNRRELVISFHPYSQTGFSLAGEISKQYPDFSEPRGRGLFIVHQLCDLAYDKESDVITCVFRYKNYQGV